jgi:hypothetical protein
LTVIINTHLLVQLTRLTTRHNLYALIILHLGRVRGFCDHCWLLSYFGGFFTGAFLFLTTTLTFSALFTALLLLLITLLARFFAQCRTLFAHFT